MTRAILFVDDDKTVLDSLKQQVRTLYGEYRCETAEDADEAWEVLEELNNDRVKVVVVVSDWLMPGTRGDELLVDIKERFPDIGCVLLTGQAPAEAEQRLRELNTVHRIMHKPWSEDELKEAIDSLTKT